jgi:TonB-dependent starch-binding outer membrane protein SusC
MKKQLHYIFSKTTVMIMLTLLCWSALAQDRLVTGKVTNASDGSGVPGSSIIIKGTSTGTTTYANGNFKINVKTANPVLVVSSVGFNKSINGQMELISEPIKGTTFMISFTE